MRVLFFSFLTWGKFKELKETVPRRWKQGFFSLSLFLFVVLVDERKKEGKKRGVREKTSDESKVADRRKKVRQSICFVDLLKVCLA